MAKNHLTIYKSIVLSKKPPYAHIHIIRSYVWLLTIDLRHFLQSFWLNTAQKMPYCTA